MDGDRVRVVDASETPRAHSPLPLIAGGIVAAFLFGYLFGAGGPSPEADPTNQVPTAPLLAAPGVDHNPDRAVIGPTTSTTSPVTTWQPEVALADLVPGFAGRLVLVGDGTAALWDAAHTAPAIATDLPASAGDVSFDSTGTRVGVLQHSRSGGVLYVGSVVRVRPLLVGVDSFAWHPEAPGVLAWVGQRHLGDDETWLFVTDTRLSITTAVVRLDTPTGFEGAWWGIAGWGDWGLVLNRRLWSVTGERFSTSAIEFDSQGTIVAEWSDTWSPGASNRGTYALAHDGGFDLVQAGTSIRHVEGVPGDLALWTDVAAVRSADGSVVLYDVTSGDVRRYDTRGRPLGFSGDGAFLLVHSFTADGLQHLIVMDVASGAKYPVRVPAEFWSVQLR